jgi:hypothetical protein
VRADDGGSDDAADVVRREQRSVDLEREFGLKDLMEEIVAGKHRDDTLLVIAQSMHVFAMQMLRMVTGEVLFRQT